MSTTRIRIAMSGNNLSIISGPPGSGKTAALAQMADQARNNGRRVTSILWPSTRNGIKRIIADHQPDYVTIDGDIEGDDLLAAATQLAHDHPSVYFIITN